MHTAGVRQSPPVPYVPADKHLDPARVTFLTARGERKVYRGDELQTIGMPCGGIGAGQLYVRGDGTLAQWWIDNTPYDTGYGNPGVTTIPTGAFPNGYNPMPYRPPSPVDQGFALSVRRPGGEAIVRRLSREGFDDIGFIGEYPIATVLYDAKGSPALPVEVRAEVYSPWIPLDARSSATPGTVLRYSVRNRSDGPLEIALGGWLQNLVWLGRPGPAGATRRNTVMRGEGIVGVSMDVTAAPGEALPPRDPNLGEVALAAMDAGAVATAELTSPEELFGLLASGGRSRTEQRQVPLAEALRGAVVMGFHLEPGEARTASFLVTWFFPYRRLVTPNRYPENRTEVGNRYAEWYRSAWDVARCLHGDFARLDRETHLARDTCFATSLPYWFVQRITMPTSTLATETVQWWRNGRFWGWEGVGSCLGTCGHVYNFAHAAARLFPELERSVRQMQDLGPNSLDEETGRVDYRGGGSGTWKVEGDSWGYAADAQAGYVLKLYREHLLSPDRRFLHEVWPKAKKIMGYLIERDAAGNDSIDRRPDPSRADGVIEDAQHTTWDSNLFGPNSYIQTWYLAALRAAEQMARVEGEGALADRYRALYESGRRFVLEHLWNGEYFVHIPPDTMRAEPSPLATIEYGDGCLSNQLLGQTWALQLGLGELYPHEMVVSALRSVFHYNWTTDVAFDPAYPDVGPRHQAYLRIRLFALPGEAALFECTWPHGDPPARPLLHNAEVFSGTEYQVASLMLQEGLISEGLAVVRAVHERYDGTRRNPWNEIECGDHYARAMAAWGCLTGVSGFERDGPAGTIGFAPRMTPDDFRCFFTAAEGWGSLVQHREGGRQSSRIELVWGRLRLRTVTVELPLEEDPESVSVSVAGLARPLRTRRDGRRLEVSLGCELTVQAGEAVEVVLGSLT